MLKTIISLLLLSISQIHCCIAQEDNYLKFRVINIRNKEPLSAVYWTVVDSVKKIKTMSPVGNLVAFNLSLLKSDSAYLTLRFAADTIATFKVYRNRIYRYEMVFYVNPECSLKKYSFIRSKKRKYR
jgi:hypothetical protein